MAFTTTPTTVPKKPGEADDDAAAAAPPDPAARQKLVSAYATPGATGSGWQKPAAPAGAPPATDATGTWTSGAAPDPNAAPLPGPNWGAGSTASATAFAGQSGSGLSPYQVAALPPGDPRRPDARSANGLNAYQIAALPTGDARRAENGGAGASAPVAPPGAPMTMGAPGSDLEAARAARDKLLADYTNAQPRPAPVVSAAVGQPVAPAQAAQAGAAQQATTATVAPPTLIPATTVGQAGQATATPVGAPVTVNGTQVRAAQTAANVQDVYGTKVAAGQVGPTATVAPTTVAATAPTSAALVNKDVQRESAAGQSGALSLAQTAATGGGPSAADAQFQSNLQKGIFAQRALVGDSHGPGRIAASLKAGENISRMTGQAAADSAALRAKEQQDAREQLLSGYTAARGQDIDVGKTDAQLGTQTALANQGTQLGTNLKQADVTSAGALADAAAKNQGQLTQAQLDQQAATDTAKMGLSAAQGNQTTQAGINQFNAGEGNKASAEQAQLDSAQNLAQAEHATTLQGLGAQLGTNVAISNAQAQTQLTALQAQITSQQGIATAEQQNQMKQLQAQLTNSSNQFNAGQQNDLTKTNATLANNTALANLSESGANSRAQLSADTQTNLANVDAQLKARGMDDDQRKAILDAMVAESGQAVGAETAIANTNTAANASVAAAKAGQPSTLDRILGGVFNVGAAAVPLLSDERQKKDVRPLVHDYADSGKGDEVEKLLSQLHPVTFDYKDPSMPGAGAGRQAGVMAQDLEKSPMGRTMVVDDGGVKKVDPSHAVGALLAAMTIMNRKMQALKGARR